MPAPGNQSAGLAAAIERVAHLDAPADATLSAFFRAHPSIGQRDRAFISEGAFGYLRRKRSLDALAASVKPRHLALATTVRELGLSVRGVEGALRDDDEAWLRALKSRARYPLQPAVAADLPDWL